MGPVQALGSRRRRAVHALQVEVSSRCTRRCAVCPRCALGDRWRDGDLDSATWAAVVPGLSRVRYLHLQGWGEPLLHPALPAMAADAKRAGCRVGITTNGDLLDRAGDWLLEGSVDLVTVSVAGASHHAVLRDGSDFDEVVARAGELAARGRRSLKVQLSFLLTRDNAGELAEVVAAAAGCGLTDVVVNHLDVTPTAKLLDRAAFARHGLREGVATAFAAATAAAHGARVRLRLPPRSPQEVLVCALDPTRFLFVAWDGRVGPCVQLLLPVDGPIPRVGFEGETEVDPVSYGRLPGQDLLTLLSSPLRRSFAGPFEARLAAERGFLEQVAGAGLGAPALEELERAERARRTELERNPFPPPCSGCHQSVGW